MFFHIEQTCIQIKRIEPNKICQAANIVMGVFMDEEPLFKSLNMPKDCYHSQYLSDFFARIDDGILILFLCRLYSLNFCFIFSIKVLL